MKPCGRRTARGAGFALPGSMVRAALLLAALVAPGCVALRPAVRPLAVIADAAPCLPSPTATRPLVVMMPGRGMALSELQAQGFVATLRRRGFDVDVLLVDAHLGYWQQRVIFEALREDVMVPARARGARQVWLAGISLGGYGALLYDARHPGEIAGVVALAPYLGLDEVSNEVARAGGLRAWPAPVLPPFEGAPAPEVTDRHLWRWLKANAAAAPEVVQRAPQVPIYLAFGNEDRFVAAQRLVAAALPAAQVVVTEGGHDWPAWQDAWNILLDRLPWPRRAECVAAQLQR